MSPMNNQRGYLDDAVIEYSRHWDRKGYYSEAFLPFKNAIRKMESYFTSRVADYIAKHFLGSAALDILDIGCSDGNLTNMLFKRSGVEVNSYIGLDINEDGLGKLYDQKSNFGKSVKLINEDINNAELNSRFDLIVLLNSSYGVSASSFQGLIERLKMNGLLIALTNSRRGDFAKYSSHRTVGFCYAEDVLTSLSNLGINTTAIDLNFTFEKLSKEKNNSICLYLSNNCCEVNDIEIKSETEILIAVAESDQRSLPCR